MKSKKGFTLIELLIVITIIGILAVAFLPSLLGAPSKARDTQRVTALQKLATVFSTMSLSDTLPETGCITADGGVGNAVDELDAADFGGRIPTDPDSDNEVGSCTGEYLYVEDPGGGFNFALYSRLENAETANVDCDDINAEGSYPTTLTTIADDTKACYAILMQ